MDPSEGITVEGTPTPEQQRILDFANALQRFNLDTERLRQALAQLCYKAADDLERRCLREDPAPAPDRVLHALTAENLVIDVLLLVLAERCVRQEETGWVEPENWDSPLGEAAARDLNSRFLALLLEWRNEDQLAEPDRTH